MTPRPLPDRPASPTERRGRQPGRGQAAQAASLGIAVAAVALGGGVATGCGATDPRPPAWEYISPAIFEPNCATSSCHSRAAAVAGLDFSTPDRGYTSLTQLWVWIVDPTGTLAEGCKPMDGKVFCQRQHRPLVTPYDPAESRVVNMLRAASAPRMPPDRPLPEADIRLVERWILNGARKSLSGTDAAPQSDGPVRDGGTPDGLTDAQPQDGAGPPHDANGDTATATDGAGGSGADGGGGGSQPAGASSDGSTSVQARD